jgi:5-methylcytosine-specific restriction endonuclease McrA
MNHVLLLNLSYEPLRVISLRHAVSLMLRGVVESVAGVAKELRTPRSTFVVPSVLRLRYYVNVPRRGATWSRRALLQRDDYTCIYCGLQVGERRQGRKVSKSEFTIDHLVPLSHGGKSTWGNTACACRWCNHRKADRTPHEAGLKLLWEPKLPRVSYVVLSGDVPEEWRIYLPA